MVDPDVPSSGEEAEGKEFIFSEPKVLEVVNGRIYYYSEVDRASAMRLNREIQTLADEQVYESQVRGRGIAPIRLHIQSNGGSIFSGLAITDQILRVRSVVPVYTFVDGCCASAATFFSIVGSRRYISQNAYMLIHQVSSFMWGKFSEFQDEMKNLERFMDRIKKMYAKYTKLPPERLEELLKHDIWFTPEECLEYGMVDEIVGEGEKMP